MENKATIEQFISENLHKFLELGNFQTKATVEDFRKFFSLLSEETIFDLEEQLNLESPKLAVLEAELLSNYAQVHLKNEHLAGLLNGIKKGIESSFAYNFDWF